MLANRSDTEGLRERADADDEHADIHMTDLLAKRGMLKVCANGPPPAPRKEHDNPAYRSPTACRG